MTGQRTDPVVATTLRAIEATRVDADFPTDDRFTVLLDDILQHASSGAPL